MSDKSASPARGRKKTAPPAQQPPQEEVVVRLPLTDLHPFPDHPFQVRDDEEMRETIQSVKEYGVIVPAIVRPREEGGYEIVAGHRRKYACEQAGLDTMPVLIRNLDRDAATIIMVDSNLQRENMLFERQYILTEEVVVETRYRTETSTDPETGETTSEQVPYDYYICYVTLENFDLSHLPVYIMGEEQVSLYAVYMATLGNRPDLFEGNPNASTSASLEFTDYDIPPEALEDETFRAMITEAEKYLGYPYVWGGSSPSTSFDCSGFISWVINHSGWDVGRLTANGLLNISTPVSRENARPGDLIFFQGTYDTAGASHVGLYVGDGMMIHCGSPISYANINTSYWQQHFYTFARLP